MKLKFFSDPDESFYAIKLDPVKEEYYLEEGTQLQLNNKISEKEEFNQWSWAQGHLLPTGGKPQTEIAIVYHRLSEIFSNVETLNFLPVIAYPSGRAFLAFESIKSEIPTEINLIIIAGLNPENNWHGVVIKDYVSLVRLQSFLEENDMKVNFEMK